MEITVLELVRGVAAFVKRIAAHQGDPEIIRKAIRALSLALRQPAEIACEIRPSPHPPPSLLLLTFRQQPAATEATHELGALTQSLPALEPPLREHYTDGMAWRTDCEAHERAWSAWTALHPDGPMAAYEHACTRREQLQSTLMEQRKACRTFTAEVGLDHKAGRLPTHLMRALRRVETWRFDPTKRAPLEAHLENRKPIERLKQQGQRDKAAAMDASAERLRAQMERLPEEVKRRRKERQPWGQKTLWVSSGRPRLDDIQFVLLVYLIQEQMLVDSPEVSQFLSRYMRLFKHVLTREERNERQLLEERFRLADGGPGFTDILRRFALPEDWRATRRFIARTLWGRHASAEREAAEAAELWADVSVEDAEEIQFRKQRGKVEDAVRIQRQKEKEWPTSPLAPSDAQKGQKEYRLDNVVRMLRAEAGEEQPMPARKTFYNWVNRGRKGKRIDAFLDGRGLLQLTEDGVAQLREMVQEWRLDGNVRALAQTKKWKPARFHKFRKRHSDKGESPREIALAIRRRGQAIERVEE